jgi:hypothetical protein
VLDYIKDLSHTLSREVGRLITIGETIEIIVRRHRELVELLEMEERLDGQEGNDL